MEPPSAEQLKALGSWIGGIALGTLGGVLLEERLRLVLRWRRRRARRKNAGTEATIGLTYEGAARLPELRSAIRHVFGREDVYKEWDAESPHRFVFTVGSFTVSVVESDENGVYFSVQQVTAGIIDLHRRVSELVAAIDGLTQARGAQGFILGPLRSCYLRFTLPYKLDHLALELPKGFDLKGAKVSLVHKKSRSIVEFTLEDAQVRTSSALDVQAVLDDLL